MKSRWNLANESLQLNEQSGNLYHASVTRINVAIALFNDGHQEDALEYAKAVLRGLEPYGAGAEEWIEKTRELIAKISGR